MASTILGMSVAATATMLGTGMNLENRRNIERQAYLLARGALESPAYSYPVDYDNIPDLADTNWINTSSRPLNLSIAVQALPETGENWPPYVTPWRRIDAIVRWTVDGRADSVKVSKMVARIQ